MAGGAQTRPVITPSLFSRGQRVLDERKHLRSLTKIVRTHDSDFSLTLLSVVLGVAAVRRVKMKKNCRREAAEGVMSVLSNEAQQPSCKRLKIGACRNSSSSRVFVVRWKNPNRSTSKILNHRPVGNNFSQSAVSPLALCNKPCTGKWCLTHTHTHAKV